MAISQFTAALDLMTFTSHKATNKGWNKEHGMVDSTGQHEDLKYLEVKYGFSREFMMNLASSPNAAKMQIQTYKNNMYFVCISFLILATLLICLAIWQHETWPGLFCGIFGAVICTYYFTNFLGKRLAIKEVETVAGYHHLL